MPAPKQTDPRLSKRVDGPPVLDEDVVIWKAGAQHMRLGVVGKGGSGKTLIAGTLARLLARRNHRVVALDLDFMPGLSMSLGLEPRDDPMFAGIAERDPSSVWGWRARSDLDIAEAVVQQSVEAPDGVRLLQIGKISALPAEESLAASVGACSQILQRLTDPELLDGWTVVGDHPAGMFQSRGSWVAYADCFVVVVEPARQSVLSARRLLALRESANVFLVANKTTGSHDVDYIGSFFDEPLLGVVPSDPAVKAADLVGAALINYAPNSAAMGSLQRLADQLEEPTRERGRTQEEARTS